MHSLMTLIHTLTHQTARPPPHTEPTFIMDNLSNVIKGVQDLDCVASLLYIPRLKRIEIRRKNPSNHDLYREVVTYCITHLPGASWLGVAEALWWTHEYAPLEIINKLFLRGKLYLDVEEL